MVNVEERIFGETIDPFKNQNEQVKCFTISNDNHMEVEVITLGATIRSIKTPDANGIVDDVVLGFDDVAGYLSKANPYFGATVGRVANRIANGRFNLPGVGQVEVSRNWNNKHQLHGGFVGFDKAIWEVVAINADGITLKHTNPDGHEGFPGQVTAFVQYSLAEDNCLHVRFTAETTKITPVNLTNHSYFNLAGHQSGSTGLYEHSIRIDAKLITETDSDSIPTGNFIDLPNTKYDLREMGNLGDRLKNLEPTLGFDDNYCVTLHNNQITTIARAQHAPSGRWIEVATNQPGVQFYTSNFMPDVKRGETPITGKCSAKYTKHGAFCLETQKYPDAVNHENFHSTLLKPGQTYIHDVIYKFGVIKN